MFHRVDDVLTGSIEPDRRTGKAWPKMGPLVSLEYLERMKGHQPILIILVIFGLCAGVGLATPILSECKDGEGGEREPWSIRFHRG